MHNLEHSNIVVSYNLTTPEEVDELRDVISSTGLTGVLGVTRFYDKIKPGTVALSAWGVSDTMSGIDEERINAFFSTYGGNLGPERIPCLNSGVAPLGSPEKRSAGAANVVAQGQVIFTGAGGCSACHTIEGISAGLVGPDLTHIGTDAGTRRPGVSLSPYEIRKPLFPKEWRAPFLG